MNLETTFSEINSRLDLLTKAVLSSKTSMTAEEAAVYLGLKISFLYKLTSTQEIPHYKPRGKMLYFKREELDEWSLQNRVKPLSEIDQVASNHLVRA